MGRGGRDGGMRGGMDRVCVLPASFPGARTGGQRVGGKKALLQIEKSSPLSPFATP